MAFAWVPNKPDALGNRDLHIHLQRVGRCSWCPGCVRPPSTSHRPQHQPSPKAMLVSEGPLSISNQNQLFTIVLLGGPSSLQPPDTPQSQLPLRTKADSRAASPATSTQGTRWEGLLHLSRPRKALLLRSVVSQHSSVCVRVCHACTHFCGHTYVCV